MIAPAVRTQLYFALPLLVLVPLGPWLPQWALFLITVSLAKGFVVLGLMLLLRAGLVSFGQGLYYCIGAYTAGILSQSYGLNELVSLLAAGTLSAGLVAALLGFLLAKYRGIFFGLLSLAFSMILYGIIVKSAALGSTDGFTLPPPSLLGWKLEAATRYAVFALGALLALAIAWRVALYFDTPFGRLAPAIRDNEIRVEYLGQSVRNAIHVKYTLAGALGGLGGALAALTVGHIDPEMAYWTTSGEFVFALIVSGGGNVATPFLGTLLVEALRSYAYVRFPNVWQMALGVALLLVIYFLPDGLAALARRRRSA